MKPVKTNINQLHLKTMEFSCKDSKASSLENDIIFSFCWQKKLAEVKINTTTKT